MIIPMLCVTIFVILVVWFLLPRISRFMIHTPTAISVFVCLSMVQLMAVFISMRCFFFDDTPTTAIYTLSLHDALPICPLPLEERKKAFRRYLVRLFILAVVRSEEHTSELQSRQYLVCRLLLEKKK